MNKLIRELIEPFLTEEEKPKIKKVVGIYGGRFNHSVHITMQHISG